MNAKRLKLGVNIDHTATLRQARGTDYPDPLDAARVCEAAGADGITVHLREDRRHIQDHDVERLRAALTLPMNLEMACVDEMVEKALSVRPDEVCIVPEKREEVTTEGGLDVAGQWERVRSATSDLMEAGIRVSLFIEADPRQVDAAHEVGAPCIELHTGAFCDAGEEAAAEREMDRLIAAARQAQQLGLQVNAGHGINLDNIGGLLRMPALDTLNIGHSIIARAVFVGLREAVMEMQKAMEAYNGGDA